MATLQTPITLDSLNYAQTLFDTAGPGAMYNYLAGFGDRYSILAQGVLDGSTTSGQAALEFMEHTALQQGVTLTQGDVDQIRLDMAQGYLDTLQGIALSSGGQVTREITAIEAEQFHDDVFISSGLGEDAWTLNTPFELFGAVGAQNYWESILNSAGNTAEELRLSSSTYFLMEYWSVIAPDEMATKMESWIERIVNPDALVDVGASFVKQFLDNTQTDPFAIVSLFSTLDQNIKLTEIKDHIAASSNMLEQGLTNILNSLGELFGVGGGVAVGDKSAFYAKIQSITDSSLFLNVAGFASVSTVDSLSESASENTANGFAYRYALDHLNTFAITAAGLYDQVALDSSNYTDDYLDDRAHMLERMMEGNVINALYIPMEAGKSEYFYDYVSGSQVLTTDFSGVFSPEPLVNDPSVRTETINYIFGDGNNNSFEGGNLNDRLYGGAGNDTISGGTGDDYIEGNQGVDIISGDAGKDELHGGHGNDTLNGGDDADHLYGGQGDDILVGGAGTDTLEGGQGLDTYIYNSGDGSDTIIDSDGEINYNGVVLSGGSLVSGNTYKSDDGSVTYIFGESQIQGGPNTLVIHGAAGTLKVNDFVSGDLDIVLGEVPVPPPAFNLITGTSFNDKDGDDDTDHNALIGTALADKIEGLGGDDELFGYEGNDLLNGGAGNDLLKSGDGSDTLDGGIGDDYLAGGAGNDTIYGGDGLNVINGNGGSDVIYGGDGTDIIGGGRTDYDISHDWSVSITYDTYYPVIRDVTIHGVGATVDSGDDEADIIFAGGGDDVAFGHLGSDTIFGELGNDVLQGGAGDDFLDGGEGSDHLIGDAISSDIPEVGSDTLIGGAGDDLLEGAHGNDYLYGGDNDDRLIGDGSFYTLYDSYPQSPGNDYLYGEDGNDSLQGREGDDHLDGGTGVDLLIGGVGNDTLVGGSGDDQLQGDDTRSDVSLHGNDILSGGDGNDLLGGQGGNDVLYGENGLDTLQGDEGDDYLDGGENDDYLSGGSGDDVLDGGAGRDTLVGGDGIDTLIGGKGTDTLKLDVDDTAVFRKGDGLDVIVLADTSGTLQFDGVSSGEISVIQSEVDGEQALGVVYSNGDAVFIKEGFLGANTQFAFSNETLSLSQLLEYAPSLTLLASDDADVVQGGGQADYLFANAGNDVIVGGLGNDQLDGGIGDDIYLFNLGDGQDTITDYNNGANNDVIQFGDGISVTDLSYTRVNDDLLISLAGGQDQISISDWFSVSGHNQIEMLEFSDNSSFDLVDQVVSQGMLDVYNDLVLTSDAGNTTLVGSLGDDRLYGDIENDTLVGMSGTDRLEGKQGNDALSGGTGNDMLMGGEGNDTYNYNLGDGFDYISEASDSANSDMDTVVFGAGISANDVTVDRQGDNVILKMNDDAGRLTISNWYAAESSKIEVFNFSDGTVWDVSHIETLLAVDTGGVGGTSTSGSELEGVIYAAGEEQLITLGPGDDIVNAQGDGNHIYYIFAGDGNDVMAGGYGPESNSLLVGGNGDDVYCYNAGDGWFTIGDTGNSFGTPISIWGQGEDTGVETISFGKDITLEDIDIRLSRNTTTNLMYASIRLPNSGGIYIGNIGEYGSSEPIPDNYKLRLQFIDETDVRLFDITGILHEAVSGPSTGWYMDYTDFLEHEITDITEPVGGIAALNYALTGELERSGYEDTVYGTEAGDVITLGLGSDIANGLGGNDHIIGGSGDDVVAGGVDNDMLETGSGDDVILYNLGDGNDLIDTGFNKGNGLNTLSLGKGISPQDVEILVYDYTESHLLTSLLLINNDSGSVDLDLSFNDNSHGDNGFTEWNFISGVEQLQFIDETGVRLFDLESALLDKVNATSPIPPGGGWIDVNDFNMTYEDFLSYEIFGVETPVGGNTAQIYALTGKLDYSGEQIFASEGDATIVGTEDDDFISTYDLDVEDYNNVPLTKVHSGDGDDDIVSNGNDIIDSGSGNDTIWLGSSNATVLGGSGSDTYNVNNTAGTYIIYENSAPDVSGPLGQSDKLNIKNYNSGNITLGFGSLKINSGDGGSVHLTNFDKNDVYGYSGIDTFILSDGTEISYVDFVSRGFDVDGDVENNELTGSNVTDRINGLAGDDVILSGDGNDVLNGGLGDDLLEGGSGDDVYLFRLGDGHDVISDVSGFDKIQLGIRITESDLSYDVVGDDLVISIGDTDSITIQGEYLGNSIEEIAFSDNAPTVTAALSDQATNEDELFSFTVPADSFDDIDIYLGDSLTLSASLADGSALPTWLSFDAETQTFSGTPINDDVGVLDIRVIATDLTGNTVSDNFLVTVTNTNDAPTITSAIEDQSATEDSLVIFTLPAGSFDDVDVDDSLSYSATLADGTELPSWLSFDALTQTFSGTPTNDDIGSIEVKVTATDTGGLSVTDNFLIDVANTNDAPTVAAVVADQTATEEALFSFTLPAGSFDDVDVGDSLSYSATLADGTELPSWLSFDALTQSFSGTPTNSDINTLEIDIVATDTSGANVSDRFILTVLGKPIYGDERKNRINGTENGEKIFGYGGNDTIHGLLGNDVLDGGSDADKLYGDEGDDSLLGFDGDDVLEGGTGNDTLDGGIGNDIYRYNLGDGSDVISNYDVTVGRVDVIELSSDITVSDVVSERIGDDLILNISDGGSLTVQNYFVSNGTAGYAVDEVRFKDGTAWTVSDVLNMTIQNERPIAGDDSSTVVEDNVIVFAVADLLANDTDADGQELTIVDVVNAVNGVVALDSVAGTITFTPNADYFGTASFEYVVSDGIQTDNAVVNIDVTPLDDAPVAQADSTQVEQDNTLVINVADLLANDMDVDGDVLSIISVENALNGAAVFDDVAGTITFTADVGYTGAASFQYTMTDGISTSSTDVSIDVRQANSAPTVIDDAVATSQDNVLVMNVVDLLANDSDVDGDTLDVVGVQNATNGTVSFDQVAGTISFTPEPYYTGPAQFEYLVSDGFAQTTGVVNVDVALDTSGGVVGTSADDSLTGGRQAETFYGLAGNDVIEGGRGNDTLIGGAGNDTLLGDGGHDTYVAGVGAGVDVVDNSTSGKNDNDILHMVGSDPYNLWFSQDGNDLVLDVIGTNDQARVQGWYENAANELDEIQTANSILINNNLDQLVTAMAAFSVPAGEGVDMSQDVRDQLEPVIAASWQTS